MNFFDRLKLAIFGITSNKFRTFLTLLGIIIGVASVILMVSLGSGTQQAVSGQFEGLMNRQIFISPNWDLAYRDRGRLSTEDQAYLGESVLGLTTAMPYYRSYKTIKYQDQETNNWIAGVLPGGLDLANLKLEYGRDISELDVKDRARVAVVGRQVLERLIDHEDYIKMIGQEIVLDGYKVMIVGILGISNATIALPNQVVLIPQSCYQEFFRSEARNVDLFLLKYTADATETDVIDQVNYLLNQKYGTVRGKSRFLTVGIESHFDVYNQVIVVLTYLLAGIAAISLLVGGIGVMNIMLVTVKERTREIGIRMAIGAGSYDIQQQFLLEAVFLTIGGGLLGIITGTGLAMLLNLILANVFQWWQGSIPLWAIALSFGVTVLIGLIFGFYPAYKASKLDPIEALRYE